jgi:hypothetical protein
LQNRLRTSSQQAGKFLKKALQAAEAAAEAAVWQQAEVLLQRKERIA